MDPDLRLPTSVVRQVILRRLAELGSTSSLVQSSGQRAVTAAATVFVNYVTCIAAEIAREKRRVGITGSDILEALSDTDFDDIADMLRSREQTTSDGKEDTETAAARSLSSTGEKAVKTAPRRSWVAQGGSVTAAENSPQGGDIPVADADIEKASSLRECSINRPMEICPGVGRHVAAMDSDADSDGPTQPPEPSDILAPQRHMTQYKRAVREDRTGPALD
mmetsp:Transcript_752/g.2444  ORF Transcript_752/g.2444 Transcript_752/m.2444 type:complete len:221 (-) Transcript_752:60-722(-)|eukprot:CAMPEP_0198735006 /NCGR_PEP_ID=MMETSP1475-20131203/56580_1 /TAXON_ID= ORGANISM="Unidentified sp., Strain CCMP1999" /NCGR_SAMPLE_ID=MMETSP1475 /ASSEMBLY_ACC=CAM_ASM_001111 /LENGTH=220 /DNA_ID=CAMNT_0044498593 /DNA_START=112 /DNA_END=774 /DNA_ORIENTATION=-